MLRTLYPQVCIDHAELLLRRVYGTNEKCHAAITTLLIVYKDDISNKGKLYRELSECFDDNISVHECVETILIPYINRVEKECDRVYRAQNGQLYLDPDKQ